jgi:DNA-3-methyladenine glycosylase
MRPGSAPVVDPASIERAYRTPFDRAYYDRPTAIVARDLLGQWLIRRTPQGARAGRITETEAYVSGDAANHAVLGPTLRNRSMFGPPGTLYVYRVHQVHCANAVTGYGTAVLLRSVEPHRGVAGDPRGPGRLCRAFDLTRSHDGTSLVDGPLRIAPSGVPVGPILTGRRIGIRLDAERPLRFAIAESPWVSSPRIPVPTARERAGRASGPAT